MRCSCEFNSSNIIDESFSCRGSQGEFKNTVVYRAMIALQVPATISDADDIVNVINEWVQFKPSVTVDKVILEVDPNCPAFLDSVTSDDCVVPSSEAPSTDQVNEPSSSSSSSSMLIGIIVGTVVIIIVLILIIIIIGIVIYSRRKSSYRYLI